MIQDTIEPLYMHNCTVQCAQCTVEIRVEQLNSIPSTYHHPQGLQHTMGLTL